MAGMIRVFLGYDPREALAFHVAAHSIHRHSSEPVAVAPLMLSQLGGVFRRPRDPKQSTDFSFTRFLVPHLCNFEGWAMFIDCDILVRDDIAKLWALRDDRCAVQVVQHDHQPRESVKFLGHVQTAYPRKNWSSLMLFNNAKCRSLSLDYVHQAHGLELHQFKWLERDDLIGALPSRWNYLVDHDPPTPVEAVSNLHYTLGGPWFDDYRECGYSREWWEELRSLLHPVSEGGWPRLPVPAAYTAKEAA
jgi:lipopolysaccharide biosynthesis glycosyltransferase